MKCTAALWHDGGSTMHSIARFLLQDMKSGNLASSGRVVCHDCLLKLAPYLTAWICACRRFDTSAIVLSSFSGWGASGANVLLLPASRYVDDQPKSPPLGTFSSSDSSGLSTTAIILIAVLGSVGVTVLVGAFFVHRYVPFTGSEGHVAIRRLPHVIRHQTPAASSG